MNESDAFSLVAGRTIHALREQRGMSQSQLAICLGISQSMLSRIERGQAAPSGYQMHKIANALALPQEALVRLVADALQRAKNAAELVLRLPGTSPWWEVAAERVGDRGTQGLVTFAVAAVLAERL